MEKYDLKDKEIKLHNVLYAITTPPDYEMERFLLLENMEDTKYDEYVLVEGGHCSCYDFDETEWEAIKYTREELIKLAEARLEKDNIYYKAEKCVFNYIIKNLKGE